MTDYHADHAWVGGAIAHDVAISVGDDGRILSLVPDTAPATGAIRLEGFTLPGFVNAHSHAFHRALRGRRQRTGDFWGWRETMYELAERLGPASYEELATAVFAEMVCAGFTAVGEFHYVHHERGGAAYRDPNEMGWALVRAAERAGIRMVLLDTCYLLGGFSTPVTGVQVRYADRDVTEWADRVHALAAGLHGHPSVSCGLAAHSVRAVTADDLRAIAALRDTLQLPLHVHVSEQPAENAACLDATGRTPTALLAETGMLGPATSVVHATHPSADDIDLLGEQAVTVVACPTTEQDLGDGLGPFAELATAGATLAIGTDSHAVVDPFAEMRGIEMHDRLRRHARGVHTPAALLDAATTGGARSLGLDGGALRSGAPADLVTLRLDSIRVAGFDPDDLASAAVFAATAADVSDVVVGGRRIVAAGMHQSVPDLPDRLGGTIRAMMAER